MRAMAVAERMTVAQFMQRTEGPRGEQLIDGELVVNQPAFRHQHCVMEIAAALREWTRADSGRGQMSLPIDVMLDEHNCFAPDVLWYSAERPLDADVRPQPLPDIAVEVRSPSTWRYDIGAKKTRYEDHGLRELWLVDVAADVVLVFRRSSPGAAEFDVSLELERGGELTSPLLPGFALALDELFG